MPQNEKFSRRPQSLEGRVFGRLTVLERAPMRSGRSHWKCVCECGNMTVVRQDNLLNWRTEGCGCRQGQGGAGVPRTRLSKVLYEARNAAVGNGDLQPLIDYYEGQGLSIPRQLVESFETRRSATAT